VALAGAAIAFVLINHALIVLVVTLARGRSLRRSIDDMVGCLPIDTALALTGACFAALWAFTPPLALLAVGPMLLIYRALWVPLLEHKSRTDPKTGLYNSEYLGKELEDALAHAASSGSRLSVVMIDLDQLRLINNRHGHLAGDQVIRAVAEVVAATASANDGLAARFGGDELCISLPDTSLERAREVADDLRSRIDEIQVQVDGNGEVMAITVSTGVAAYPDHADSVDDLLRAADGAVYDAKLGGRNRTRTALPPAVQRALALDAPPGDLPEPPAADPGASAPALNGDVAGEVAPAVEEEAPATGQRTTLSLYVGVLIVGAAIVAGLSSYAAIPDSPWLFGALIASVVLLDAVRIDVFERANLSPAAIPTLALAGLYGPVGPIAAEAVIAMGRIVRRDPVLKWGFDLGALSLAGAAAAATFDAFPDAGGPALIAVAVVAGAVYYVVNSSLLAIVMGIAESRGPVPVWRERLAWMAPHYLVFGLIAGTFIIAEAHLGAYTFAIFGLPVITLWIAEKQYLDRSRANVTELRAKNDELEAANARMRRLLEDNQQLLTRMHRSYLSTITSLARAVEAKDPYTSGHTERVARIALILAEELGFDESDRRAIEVGAIIHDIGKVGIPDEILLKPGPLDPEEAREMRKHPELSSYIVADLELPSVVKQMVRSHHERHDGNGYPDGLAGEEIPLAGRLLSVADALDAMTSDRPYRDAMPPDEALREIQAMAGTQFCPRVVAALMDALDRNPELRARFRPAPAEPELATH
jgi:diguanylate cyclase (GGDEF)-like protein/putative nucleotidyltransferase with HDIG domain